MQVIPGSAGGWGKQATPFPNLIAQSKPNRTLTIFSSKLLIKWDAERKNGESGFRAPFFALVAWYSASHILVPSATGLNMSLTRSLKKEKKRRLWGRDCASLLLFRAPFCAAPN